MSHFAEIDDQGIVQRVLVVPDSEEHRGQKYLSVDLLLGGAWIQCSYNATIRKNYPGAGYFYDAGRDAFIPPKPFPSWILDEDTCQWSAPVPYPEGSISEWDESTRSWVEVLP